MKARALFAIVLAVAIGTVGAASAPAQGIRPRGDLALIGITGVLGPGSRPATSDAPEGAEDPDETLDDVILRVAVTNSGETTLDDLRVTAGLHPPPAVRSVLHRALDDDDLDSRSLLAADGDVDGVTIEVGETLGVRVTFPSIDIPWPEDPAVLPIAIGLFSGSEQLDTLTTAVVWLPRPVVPTLHEVVVVPLTGEMSVRTTGTYPASALAATAVDSPLRTTASVLGMRAGAAVVVAPDVALIEELVGRAGGYVTEDGTVVGEDDDGARTARATLDELTALVRQLPLDPVVGPYAQADIAALTELTTIPQISALAPEVIAMARTRLQGLVGRAPDLGTHLATTTTTPAAVDLVRDQRILMPYSQTTGPPADNEPALSSPLGQVASSTGSVAEAFITDPHVDAVVASTSLDDGLGAVVQRLRVELAQLWLEAPSRDRALLVIVPEAAASSRRLLSGWLDVLLDDPWLAPAGPREVTGQATRSGVTVTLAANVASATPPIVGVLGTDIVLLSALDAATADLNGPVLPLAELRDTVLRASRDMVNDPPTALAELAAVQIIVEGGFGAVDIGGGSRTLTSEVGDIPVTIRRVSGGPLNVTVRVESTGRLVWDPGTQVQRLTLAANTSQTVAFSTRAVSRGTFPVTVTVMDPTQTKVLATTTLTVRSTAFASPPSLLLIGLVVVGLLTVSYRRRRRPLELVGASD